MSDLKFRPVDADNSGAARHIEAALPDVWKALEEQEVGSRAPGDLKLSLTLTFSKSGEGCTVVCTSKLAVPALQLTKGCYAQMTPKGNLVVMDATQQDLPLKPYGAKEAADAG